MAAKVIRGGGSDDANRAPNRASAGMHALPNEDDSVAVKADQILGQAAAHARGMHRKAEDEAKASIEAARQKGEQEGRESMTAHLEIAERLSKQLEVSVEKDALDAAVESAKELMFAELKHRPGAIVDVVRQALASAKHQREIFVRVNPKDAVILKERKRELLDVLSRARDVDIREDPNLAQGGCMIETEIGLIDGQLGTQLDVLSRRLLGLGG